MPGSSGNKYAASKDMRALLLLSYGEKPVMVTRPIPKPDKGEVLVRIAASPINPSDKALIEGKFNRIIRALPFVPGLEASGTVIAAGSGLLARFMLGKRVWCTVSEGHDGPWAEYMVTKASRVVPLSDSTSLDRGSMIGANPITTIALLDIAQRGKHSVVLNTAAASALGRMMVRLAIKKGITIVNIVHSEDQVELIRSMGAVYVFSSTDENFEEKLSEICHRLNIRLAFDAVGGEMTNLLVEVMPDNGRVIVYGNLSNQDSTINPQQLISSNKSVEGFWLVDWAARLNYLKKYRLSNYVQNNLQSDFMTVIRARVSLNDAMREYDTYFENMTSGKVLILPTKVAENKK